MSVYAESLESFKQRIVQQTLPPPPPSPVKPQSAPVVFINTERRDRSLAETIREHMDTRLLITLPVGEGTAAEVREDLEFKLTDCDALIVVYGQIGPTWVERQLMQYNRIAPREEMPVALVPVTCPDCHSDQVINGGQTETGQQRYRCQQTHCAHRSSCWSPRITVTYRRSKNKSLIWLSTAVVSGIRPAC